MSLLAEIQAKCSAELLASRNTQAIADQVNVGRTRLQYREIGIGTILETIGTTDGNAFLDVLTTAPDFRHGKTLVLNGTLNIASPLTIAIVNSMVPAVLSQAAADLLIALAFVPDHVSEYDVRKVCYADNGDWLA